ncbi:MAG: hypothetical protein HOP11_09120 [Saprospiraceae bacterium]|nr:hypothetical protein [Saprospiraceae bacterium]
MIFTLCYFLTYAAYHKSNLGKMIVRQFHEWFNENLSDYFDNVRMFAQPTNNKPITCKISTATFQLKGMGPVKKGDDTVINFVNSKKLIQELQQAQPNSTGSNLELQHFSFSYWSFFILPITLLLSLWLASFVILPFRWKAIIASFFVLTLLMFVEFLSTLIRMRYNVLNMEPYAISDTFKTINNAFNSAFEIEFV